MKPKSVVVTVTDAALVNIKTVADQLAAKGMKVDRVLPVTGVITGSCLASKKASLGKIEGVHSVEVLTKKWNCLILLAQREVEFDIIITGHNVDER